MTTASDFSFTRQTDDVDPLQGFRDLCHEICDAVGPHAITAPLQNILAVGALHKNGKLGWNDALYLWEALIRCWSVGVPVSPDFKLTPLNMLKGPDHDFLNPKQDHKADMVISCAIFKPNFDVESRPMPALYRGQVSPFYKTKNAWHDAADRCGARVIVAIGDSGFSSEITGQDFTHAKGRPSAFCLLDDGDTFIDGICVYGASLLVRSRLAPQADAFRRHQQGPVRNQDRLVHRVRALKSTCCI